MSKSALSVIQLVLALAGFFIASLLYFAHGHDIDLPCTASGQCDIVNSSAWSEVAHVPVALLGACGYAVIAVLAMLKLTTDSSRTASWLRWATLVISVIGASFSWYLQYVAAVYVGAFCIWCRTSAIIMTLILLTAAVECVQASRSRATSTPAPAEFV